jgi:hypothetical protein
VQVGIKSKGKTWQKAGDKATGTKEVNKENEQKKQIKYY